MYTLNLFIQVSLVTQLMLESIYNRRVHPGQSPDRSETAPFRVRFFNLPLIWLFFFLRIDTLEVLCPSTNNFMSHFQKFSLSNTKQVWANLSNLQSSGENRGPMPNELPPLGLTRLAFMPMAKACNAPIMESFGQDTKQGLFSKNQKNWSIMKSLSHFIRQAPSTEVSQSLTKLIMA